MAITRANKIAEAVVHILHDRQLLDKVPKTKIAQDTGVNRMTVTKRLEADDIGVQALIATAESIGVDPVEILQTAIKQTGHHKSSALAEEEE